MRTSEPPDRAPWTLAASVPQADIDYGAWSRYRGNPHAYPPYLKRMVLDDRECRAEREILRWGKVLTLP